MLPAAELAFDALGDERLFAKALDSLRDESQRRDRNYSAGHVESPNVQTFRFR